MSAHSHATGVTTPSGCPARELQQIIFWRSPGFPRRIRLATTKIAARGPTASIFRIALGVGNKLVPAQLVKRFSSAISILFEDGAAAALHVKRPNPCRRSFFAGTLLHCPI